MTVGSIDDADAGEVEAVFLRDRTDLAFRADQDGLDDAGLERLDRAFQRFDIARVGDGGRDGLQALDAGQ